VATAVALVVAAAFAGCGDRRADRRERVVLAVTRTPNAALVHLALASGDFAAEGLEVDARVFPYGQLALAALVDGGVDLATAADTPLLLALLGGAHARVLASISSTTRGSELIVRAGGPVAAPKDLAGRRVGVTRGTTSEFFLERVLARSGLRLQDVVLVDRRPEALADALGRGEVDAVAAFPPYAAAIRAALGARAAVLDELASFSAFALVAAPGFLERRGPVAERVLRALLRAERRARQDREGSEAIVARALAMDRRELAAVWDHLVLGVQLEQSLLVLLEQEARWATRTGHAPPGEVPDLRRALAPEPLRTVSPHAVRLLW
jgi:NitT/TauT family transport system substrate-binding protein